MLCMAYIRQSAYRVFNGLCTVQDRVTRIYNIVIREGSHVHGH